MPQSRSLKDGSGKELQEILSDVGFETAIDDLGYVKAFSDVQYPAVKKSKFEQVYEKAKGKIKEMFSAIKNRVNSKNQNQVKENEENERE